PDWDRTEYFLLFGVAEDHASNPIKMGLGKLKERGVKVTAINPVRSGYGAIADEWVGIKPGTDGLFVAALIHELFEMRAIDLDYLVRYTNAPWLVIQSQGSADDGLFARDEEGNPLVHDTSTDALASGLLADVKPSLSGEFELADGRRAVPVFQLLAERFGSGAYAPDRVAAQTGLEADVIRRIARELAEAAFEKEVVLDIPWTDWAGRRHEKMIGRPVSMHAMRGISAHSNGFNTCRLIHLLQIILGSIDCPGGFRYKPPFPKAIPPHLKPAGKLGSVQPDTPLAGAPLGFVEGPEDLLVDEAGDPLRIDKAYSWDAPVAAHGLMHMVLNNAAKQDPYGLDVLFMYMANMSWNSSMNVQGVLDYLTAKDDNGDYKIPKIIYSDAYFSEMVPYADLILPDTTYLERWDCISLLDRPISEPDGPADSIRQPVVKPDRDVRPFQDVLIDLGGRLGLPGFTNEDGSAKYPGGYPDYIVNHERTPGVGPLAGWRGEDGSQYGKGAVNPDQLERYIENGCFNTHHLPDGQRFFKHANADYLEWAKSVGFIGSTEPIVFQLYSEPLQKFRLAAQGHGDIQPPDHHRRRIDMFFDPLPFWYAPFEGAMLEDGDYPLHAITQRPMHMYHSWGSQNAWLRQITAQNKLFMNREMAKELEIRDDDWVWIYSHIGRVKAQVALMEGVNSSTVWTWNAIGKRKGAWALDDDAPEATRGFLLNHLISELLPERDGGYRYSNSDPITGQAAWYDLRVRIEKADGDTADESLPRFEPLRRPNAPVTPDTLTFGSQFREGAQ
ncbi:MAG: molybdopterin oxidoreductase family protein, partial [Pseudomonadota bacterium]